jgi:CRISPR-associated endonuclease/helicase Cas3
MDFVQLEQFALYQKLLGEMREKDHAKYWWTKQPTWCAELQRKQPFRRSAPDAAYCLYTDEEDMDAVWTRKDDSCKPVTYPETESIETKEIVIEAGNQAWLALHVDDIYDSLSESLAVNRKYVSKVFGELRLREDKEREIVWSYHSMLGVYCEIDAY